MRDIAVRPIVGAVVAIALAVIIAVVVVLAMLRFAGMPFGGDRVSGTEALRGGESRLYAAPQPLLAQDRQAKEKQLQSAGWVDKNAGIAHIPIDDAMDILAARHAGEQQR